ncbi:hypothetical protein PJL18_01526 [Paenarthrobacter nicotinovorans]|nr:hypothetical protein [Paenarthrobacter nicotinovorans]
MVVVRVALRVQRVPDGDGHTEEALARYEPVAVQAGDPVFVAGAHEGRVEVDFLAACDQALTAFLVAATVADVPLAGGDNFEWLVALFEEVHRVGDLLRFAIEQVCCLEQFHYGFLGGEGRLARDRGIRFLAGVGSDPFRGVGDDAAVAAHDGACGQLEFAPPGDVGQVTERTHHGDAGTLVRLGERVGLDLKFHVEERGLHGLAEERLVPLVVGVGHQRGAGSQQFRTGGLDEDLFAVFGEERIAVVGAGDFAVLELGLRHSGTEGHVPQGGCLGHVGVARSQVGQEGALGHGTGGVVNGAVGQVPVHGQAEGLEQVLEDLLVLNGEFLAQFDEVLARNDVEIALVLGRLCRGSVVRLVRDGGIAAHTVVVLDAALGRQPVVIPAHGVEDVLARHPHVTGLDVGLGEGEHVAHVERA